MATHARSTTGAGGVRSVLLTCLSVVLSALGHSLATGTGPSWHAVAAGSAAVSAVVLPLTRRRRTLPENAGLLAALQLALHVFFSATMPRAPVPHAHSMGAPHTGMEPSPWAASLPDVPMMCAHLVAAVCTAWLLRAGDAAAARAAGLALLYLAHAAHLARGAVRGAATAARHPLGGVAALLRRVPRPGDTPPAGPRTRLAHEVTRRGPPRWTAGPPTTSPRRAVGGRTHDTVHPRSRARVPTQTRHGTSFTGVTACVRPHDSVSSPPP